MQNAASRPHGHGWHSNKRSHSSRCHSCLLYTSLALASYPPYDPNAFIAGGEAAANVLLDSRNPLVNYAIGSRDTPGSIFKVVTATAGLTSGQLGLHEIINDGGRYTKYDQTNPPRCWINQNLIANHSNQDVALALTRSCNYFFYRCV